MRETLAIIPRYPLSVRVATAGDLPFIDRLQKMHSKMVGWMPTTQLEGKIGAGQVIIAEESGIGVRASGIGSNEDALSHPNPETRNPTPVGYCIGQDQYFKRDDVGIIYQMNVLPAKQRGLIGATLVKAMFERAAYGCRLFCCWCAQDIEANYFWESLGFIPLAFRSGSRGKRRIHIFWQRRTREGDTTTPYWFPAQTSAGSIREDRLVLPIPPGTHWRDVMPVVLPGEERANGSPQARPCLADRKKNMGARAATTLGMLRKPPVSGLGRLSFAPPPPKVAVEKSKKAPRQKVKNNPKHVAAARELRDRWLEQVNAPGGQGGTRLLSSGKYDVSRQLPGTPTANSAATVASIVKTRALLPAA